MGKKFMWGRPFAVALLLVVLGVSVIALHPETAAAIPPTFSAHGSARQVYATGFAAGTNVALVAADSSVVATRQANAQGGVLFRDVTPGSGYRVKDTDANTISDPLTVYTEAPAPWDPSIYNQPIADDGYQYLTTRDGTQLALTVHLPLNGAKAPYPTLIEYAGYGYAKPSGPESGISKLANVMGFAVVDVNMRGTGCSGGAYDYFEPLQSLDAYDVIETISNQDWVLNNQVGMLGISYGGISQLFTARINPPHLAAIAPLSVLDASATTMYPGGMRNTGFALNWIESRDSDAQPAGPDAGQGWAWDRIMNGDVVCAANQVLHGEAVSLVNKMQENTSYVPEVADPLDPVTFVHEIHMPVFMACQWQDEQTGGHCPALVSHFTGTDNKWFTFTNGAHIDSLDPATLNRLFDFYELFVAERPPSQDAAFMRAVAPIIYQTAMNVPDDVSLTLPDDPIQDMATYSEALAAFKALPEVTVRFENGAGKAPDGTFVAGSPYANFEAGFSSLPVPGTAAQSWYLGANGSLTNSAPTGQGIDAFTWDADALPLNDYDGNTGGGGLWSVASQWTWNWKPNPPGSAVSYVSAPLSSDTTVVGSGAVYVWVKSSTPNLDLQATVSEVRPDGKETFVQNGWVRATNRVLSTDSNNLMKQPSTLLDPILTFTAADNSPLPSDQFVKVAIPLYYQGHAYRAGSRLRVTIAAPNGSQPSWSFKQSEPASGSADVQIAYSPAMPSSIVLPVVSGVDVPAGLPACGILRNQPCRSYVALANRVIEGPVAPPMSTTTTTSTTPGAPPTTAAPNAVAPIAQSPNALAPRDSTAAGSLPATGADLWLLLMCALGLSLTGLGLVFARRANMGRS